MVQNVVKKPGCETFEIDFGDVLNPKKPPVLGKKEFRREKEHQSLPIKKRDSKSERLKTKSLQTGTRLFKSASNPPERLTKSASFKTKSNPRRPLKKVEKDESNKALQRRLSQNNGFDLLHIRFSQKFHWFLLNYAPSSLTIRLKVPSTFNF